MVPDAAKNKQHKWFQTDVKNKQNNECAETEDLQCFPARGKCKVHAGRRRVRSGPRSLQGDMTGQRERCTCTESQEQTHVDSMEFLRLTTRTVWIGAHQDFFRALRDFITRVLCANFEKNKWDPLDVLSLHLDFCCFAFDMVLSAAIVDQLVSASPLGAQLSCFAVARTSGPLEPSRTVDVTYLHKYFPRNVRSVAHQVNICTSLASRGKAVLRSRAPRAHTM